MTLDRGPPSLLRQLTLRLSLLTLAALVLVAGGITWRTIATVHSIDDSALASQAQMLAGQLSSDSDRGALLPDAVRSMFAGSDGESIYVVVDPAGRLRDTSDPRTAPRLRPFAAVSGFFRVPRSRDLPQGMLGYGLASGPWRILVAQRNEQKEQIATSVLTTFFFSIAWILIPVGIAAVSIVAVTIRRYLCPLHEAARAAEAVGPAAPGLRVPHESLPCELQPLVAAVNHGLDRMQDGLTLQRQLIGNVAHALRTPIAVLTARLDLMQGEGLAPLRADVARMRRLVAQMLEVARLERPVSADVAEAGATLGSAAVEAIEQAAPLALGAGKDIALHDRARGLCVAADHRALVVVILNLVENAVQHTPPGTTVDVELDAPGSIRVADRGPGVNEAERGAIFARFHRTTGAPEGGAGLGLAIVSEIVGLHGGSVRVESRPEGGACFVVELPAAGASLGARTMSPAP